MYGGVYGVVYNHKDYNKIPMGYLRKIVKTYHKGAVQIVSDDITNEFNSRIYKRIQFITNHNNGFSDELKKKISNVFNKNIRVIYYIIKD